MNRRLFLQWSGAGTLSCLVPAAHATSTVDSGIELTAKPGKANLVGPEFPATDVWGFNGQPCIGTAYGYPMPWMVSPD